MIRLTFTDPRCAEILAQGKVLALPTETVYGLGVRWDSPEAYETLCRVKNRRPSKPIAVMTGTHFPLDQYFEISPKIRRVMSAFLPGPLTVLVPAKKNAPLQTHLGTFVAGIRIPAKESLLTFLDSLPFPLQVTSANLSGKPATGKEEEVEEVFRNEKDVPAIVEGTCVSSVPTTVVDLTKDEPVLIRQGEIPLSEIQKIWEEN